MRLHPAFSWKDRLMKLVTSGICIR
jgi:hypothetical protein